MSAAEPKRWSVAIAAALSAGALGAAPRRAAGHEVLHEVQHGRAVAVKVTLAGGDAIADADFEVFSPANPRVAHQKGRTDRHGMLSFVPDVAGAWRVRVVDAGGHGLDASVDLAAAELQPRAPAASAPPVRLGPVGGVGLVGALFAMLFLVNRKRRAR